jgi:hypothetical protein
VYPIGVLDDVSILRDKSRNHLRCLYDVICVDVFRAVVDILFLNQFF